MKKGFTLIELLAVIIILSIISIISVPIILDIVENSKIQSGLNEANLIYKEIVKYCETEEIHEGIDEYKKICNNNLKIEQIEKIVNLGTTRVEEVEYFNGKLLWLKLIINDNIYGLKDKVMQINIKNNPYMPNSFETDSWEVIKHAIDKQIFSSYYSIGDLKSITLSAPFNNNFNIRISNISTPNECNKTGQSQSACGIVLEFADIIDNIAMNVSNTNVGGWPNSDVYSILNLDENSIYNSLPEELKKIIIPTYVVSSHGSTIGENNFTSVDKLYLLSAKEVWNENPNGLDSAAEYTRQLDIYSGVTTKNGSNITIKKHNGINQYWWLRSAYLSNAGSFLDVPTYTGWHFRIAKEKYGVSPAFRIGI